MINDARPVSMSFTAAHRAVFDGHIQDAASIIGILKLLSAAK